MRKLKMKASKTLTFEEGCNKYLEYCRQRNLRQGTINHYRQSYVQFFKFCPTSSASFISLILETKRTFDLSISVCTFLSLYIL